MDSLRLRRPLAFLDVESTGTSPKFDRIVEIAVVKLYPDGKEVFRYGRINPGVPIPPEATGVHGITDEDVASAPPFAEIAHRLHELFLDCDFAGFGISRFDLPLLRAEFERAGIKFSYQDRAVIDAMSIFHLKEQRTLAAAMQFYCGRPHPRPHSARDDVRATIDVLQAQLERYADLPREVEALYELHRPAADNWIDPDGKLVLEHGTVTLGFGQHRGKPLTQLAREQPDYLEWMLKSDFSDEVKHLIRAALNRTLPREAAQGSPQAHSG